MINKLKHLPPFYHGIGLGIATTLVLTALLHWTSPQGAEVLVIGETVEAGTALQESHLSHLQIPTEYLSPQTILVKDSGLILGKTARDRLEKGSPLRWQDFAEESLNPARLSAQIPEGFRALVFSPNQESALQKWLKPGDHIDILGTFSQGQQQITRTLFQKVRLLQTKPQLLVLVTPEQAELLLFARQQGTLFALLRNHSDDQVTENLPEQEFQRFLGLRAERAAKPTARNDGPQILPLGRRR